MSAALETHGLEKSFGALRVARAIDFRLERGARHALIGPNGAGKTTLLETLLGRRVPAEGRVRLGHDVEPAYFSQHEAERDGDLDEALTAVGELGHRRQRIRPEPHPFEECVGFVEHGAPPRRPRS